MSRFNLWENSETVLPLSAFFTTLDEGKGLPIGWVSVWVVNGEKVKNQKQKDGWIKVPKDTPLGQQPVWKHVPKPGTPDKARPLNIPKQFSADEEMMSYLKSVNFDAQTAQFTKNTKFVADMLAKFGTGWFDRYKKMKAVENGEPTAVVPVAPPTNPVDAAIKQLGYSSDSKAAFFIAQMHKFGGTEGAVNAYSKKYGMKYAKAYWEVEPFWKKAQSAGVINVSSKDELDVTVTFNTGTAPAETPPVVVTPPTTVVAPPVVPAAPPPVAVPAVPVAAPVGIPPALAPVVAQDPTWDETITKLGYKSGTDAALAVSLLQNNKGDVKDAAAKLSAASGIAPAVAALVVSKVKKDMAALGSVPGPPQAPTVPAAAKLSGLSDILLTPNPQLVSTAKQLGFGLESDEAKVLAMWQDHMKLHPADLENIGIHAVAQKIVNFAGWGWAPAIALTKSVVSQVKALPVAPVVPYPTTAGVPPEPKEPDEPKLTPVENPKVLALAAKLGMASDSAEAKALSHWRDALKEDPKKFSLSLDVAAKSIYDLFNTVGAAGWNYKKCRSLVSSVAGAATAMEDWDIDDFLKDTSAPEPVVSSFPLPLAVFPHVTSPKAQMLAVKLGATAFSQMAKTLGVWRTFMKEGPDADRKAAEWLFHKLNAYFDAKPESDNYTPYGEVLNYVQAVVKKALDSPGWFESDFASDEEDAETKPKDIESVIDSVKSTLGISWDDDEIAMIDAVLSSPEDLPKAAVLASELLGIPVGATAEYVGKIHKRLKDAGAFDPGIKITDKRAEELFAKDAGMKSAVEKALGGKPLSYLEQKIVGMLWYGGADAFGTQKALANDYGDIAKDIVKKLLDAGIYSVIHQDEKGELAGPPFESRFVVPSAKKKPVTPQVPALPGMTPLGLPTAAPALHLSFKGLAPNVFPNAPHAKASELAYLLGHSKIGAAAKVLSIWREKLKKWIPEDAELETIADVEHRLKMAGVVWAHSLAAESVKSIIQAAGNLLNFTTGSFAAEDETPVGVQTKNTLDNIAPGDISVSSNPKAQQMAALLGYGIYSVQATVLSIWRKNLQKHGKLTNLANEDAAWDLVELLKSGGKKWTFADALAVISDLDAKATGSPAWNFTDFITDALSADIDWKQIAAAFASSGAESALGKKHPAAEFWANKLTLNNKLADTYARVLSVWRNKLDTYQPSVAVHQTALALMKQLQVSGTVAGKAALTTLQDQIQTLIDQVKGTAGFNETEFGLGDVPSASAMLTPPAKSAPQAAVGAAFTVVLPTPPPLSALTGAGDAKSKLGGNKPKQFMKDALGNMFLYKHGADPLRAAAGAVASNISALVVGPGEFVPVTAVKSVSSGEWGTLQPMVPDATMIGTNDTVDADLKKLTKEQISQLQRERVIDWVISNHDSKIGNFIAAKDGSIFGIDKEQAFKFIGKDKLSLDFKPNPSAPIYNALYAAYANKQLDLDPNDMLPYIQSIEGVSEADWKKAVQPYLDALPASERDAKWMAIIARKNGARAELENFITKLKEQRKEMPPGEFHWYFPKTAPSAAPKKTTAVAPGVVVPPPIPSVASLTYQKNAQGIGGAGEKHFYIDDSGKKWLLKVASDKNSGTSQPWKAAAQIFYSKIGLAVKPTTVPIGPAEYKDKQATLQPWLGDNIKSLSGTSPTTLTPSQMKDVADEHVLDWLMSNHDTHGANLLKLTDGSIVGIDKEQAFKFFLPSLKWAQHSPDKLSTDYHPNTMENAPYYNQFWKDFAAGKMNFDPVLMRGAIEAVEKIPDDTYVKALADYVSAAFPNDAAKAGQLYDKALERKHHLRVDFEGFIGEQYKKRTSKKGVFTFAYGWVPEGMVATAPAATAQPIPQAPIAPTSYPPGYAYVPKPANYTPPSFSKILQVASSLGLNSGSVYFKALRMLADYNNNVADAAAQLSFHYSTPYPMALKRVKYVAKKLKTLGGWGVPVVSVPAGTPEPVSEPMQISDPTPTAVTPPKPEDVAAASTSAQKALQVATNLWEVPETDTNTAQKGVLAWIIPSGEGVVVRPDTDPIWAKLAEDPTTLSAVSGAVFDALDSIAYSDFDAMVRPIAEAQHPGDKLLQDAFVQGALNRKNTTKRRVEEGLTAAIQASTGSAGSFTFKGGWLPTGAKVKFKPIIQVLKKTATEVAAEMNIKIRDWKEKDASGAVSVDLTKKALKVYGADGPAQVEAFLKKIGMVALGPAQAKGTSEHGGNPKWLIPVSTEALEKAFATEEKIISPEEQEQAAAAGKDNVPLQPAKPAYMPSHAPAIPIAQAFEDMNDVTAARLGIAGKAYPSDGPAMWGSTGTINVRRVVDTNGANKVFVTFRLKPEVKVGGTTFGWKGLVSKGASVDHNFWTGSFDSEKDAIVKTGSVGTTMGAREWSEGKHKLRMVSDSYKFSLVGTMMAELELGPGEKLTEVLSGLLDKVQPGLGAAVIHAPTATDREVQKLHQILFAEAPALERKLQEGDFTVATLTSKVTAANLTAYLDSKEVEVLPGLKSFYKPGRWKTLLPKGSDGLPAVKFMSTSAGTPKYIVQALQHSGPACVNSRYFSGSAASGHSDSEDVASGGGAVGMWRMITTASAKSGLYDGVNIGNTSGPYKYIVPADELDRLDVMHYNSDGWGSFGKGNGAQYWEDRKPLSKAIEIRDGSPSGTYNAETDFFNGVHTSRIVRIVAQNEDYRRNLIIEARKQGLLEVNGVPIEDFVVVEKSAQAVYDKYVKPLGL